MQEILEGNSHATSKVGQPSCSSDTMVRRGCEFLEHVCQYLATFIYKNGVVSAYEGLAVAFELSVEEGKKMWSEILKISKGLQQLYVTRHGEPVLFLKNILAVVFISTDGSFRHHSLARLLWRFGGNLQWIEDLYDLEKMQRNPLEQEET